MKKAILKKLAKKVSPYKRGANVRKFVKQKVAELNKQFGIGDFVSEKYVTRSVGMIMGEVQAKKRVITLPDMDAQFLSERYYRYEVKVLWLFHPGVEAKALDQIADWNVKNIKIRSEKKAL